MAERSRDIWAEWLLRRGTAGDKEGWVNFLRPVRDRVLGNAQLSGGETLLDVGAGDGLIAFGALERMGEEGRVILSDVSQDLLDHSRSLAEEKGVAGRWPIPARPRDRPLRARRCVSGRRDDAIGPHLREG